MHKPMSQHLEREGKKREAMGVGEEAGIWLREALLGLSVNPSSGIDLDPDVVSTLVSYCQLAPPPDAKEYLTTILGKSAHLDVVISGYFERRGDARVIEKEDGGGTMQAYVKPRIEESRASGSNKKASRMSKSRQESSIEGSSFPLGTDNKSVGSVEPRGKTGSGKSRKVGKGVSIVEAMKGRMLLNRGAPCDCQAKRHKLVNNCISCGKIVCEQEGEGPCNFCGALVLCEGSDYGGLDGIAIPFSDAEAAAQAFKDRLVEYDRTVSQRTTVIDDQGDYFQIEGNTWLSQEEKQLLQKRQEEIEQAEEAQKKKVVISIDLLGRKVLMADDTDTNLETKTSVLTSSSYVTENIRIKPNPNITETPVFVDTFKPRPSNPIKVERAVGNGRVQHDDPVIDLLQSGVLKKRGNNGFEDQWKMSSRDTKSSQSDYFDEDCLQEFPINSGSPSSTLQSPEVLDLCPEEDALPAVNDSHSILEQREAEKNQVALGNLKNSKEPIQILKPGMVLLKYWLTPSDQIDIVKQCRMLGIGPGGFYHPSYGEENKMHLWMMCLGNHWEPTTKSYESRRWSHDNATPPPVPPSLSSLAGKALAEVNRILTERSRRSNNKECQLLPSMDADICLVNFYEQRGKLGMHQDRDESTESLNKGIPVVSFSIGDSAEFIYGWDRDADKAERVILESGDVLVFGGPSRLIFHAVGQVFLRTAPSWLIKSTNLRSGRLNLTFRQL